MATRRSLASLLAGICICAVAMHAQDRSGEVLLKGTVETAGSHQPLEGVHLTLGESSAVSGPRGGFSFPALAPGSYTIQAELPGYLKKSAEMLLEVSGSRDPVTIALTRSATIEGIVEDPDGRPLPNVAAGLLSQRYSKRPDPLGLPTRTDDQGRFTIHDLAPGAYFLRASATHPAEGRNPPKPADQPFRDVYYPRSPDFAGAVPLVLAAGATQTGIHLRLLPPESYSVSGRVSGALEGAKLSVRLRETDSPAFGLFLNKEPRAAVAADGTFRIDQVPPGGYSLLLYAGPSSLGKPLPVTILDRDADNLLLFASPGVPLTGKIDDPKERFKNRHLILILMGANQASLPAQVSDTGAFSFESAKPGKYRVFLFDTHPDFAVNQVAIGGRTFDGEGFEFTAAGNQELTVTLGDGGTIAGVVDTGVGPRTGLHAVVTATLTPVDAALGLGPMHNATSQPDGAFAIRSLPPGQYRVCAWGPLRADLRKLLEAPGNQAFLDKSCKTVNLAPDGGAEAHPTLIPEG